MKNLRLAAALTMMTLFPFMSYGLEPVEGVLELTGSIGTSGMAAYTPAVDVLSATTASYSGNQFANSILGNTSLTAYLAMYILNNEPLYMIAPYFRFGTVFTGKDIKGLLSDNYWSSGVYQDRKDNFDMSYFGAGIRRYFIDSTVIPVNLYLGGDLGYFSTLFMNPHSTLINYTDPSDKENSLIESNSINRFSGGFFGFHLEAGMDYWINNSLGVTLKGGFRNGSGRIKGTLNSVDRFGNATGEDGKTKEQDVSVSGVYLSAGIILSFGTKTVSKPAMDKAPKQELPPAAVSQMSKGDAEYAAKNYSAALKHYDTVLFYAQNAQIYKRMANCLFYLGEKDDAMRLYELSLKMNPEDAALEAWLQNQ